MIFIHKILERVRHT